MDKNRFKSKLFTSEDYWAIWLGGFFLIAGSMIFLVFGSREMMQEIRAAEEKLEAYPISTISRLMAEEDIENLKGINTVVGKKIKKLFR